MSASLEIEIVTPPVVGVVLMSAEEARSLVRKVNACVSETKFYLLNLYEQDGWQVLGYPTWKRFLETEIKLSRQHAQRLMAAAKVERNLSPMGDIALNERQARELARVPLDRQREVYDAAVRLAEESDDKRLTISTIRKVAIGLGLVEDRSQENAQKLGLPDVFDGWGREISDLDELGVKLSGFDGKRRLLWALLCVERAEQSLRWESACEVESVTDVDGELKRLRDLFWLFDRPVQSESAPPLIAIDERLKAESKRSKKKTASK